MPTYEYSCDACGYAFEREQRIVEDPIKKCPKCGKLKARRMITQSNFILKGGGWYADGYGSSPSGAPKNESSGSVKPPAPSEAKTDTSSSDAKPESKPKDSASKPTKKIKTVAK